MPFLVYLTVMMPFRLCFNNEPVVGSGTYWFEFLIETSFLVDIILNFRTGYFFQLDDASMRVEFHPVAVTRNYMLGWFALDLASGIPFMLIELLAGSSNDAVFLKMLKSLRFFKLIRLLKSTNVLKHLDQDVIDQIQDFYEEGTTRSALVLGSLIVRLGFIVHIASCFYVLVGRSCSMDGIDNW